MFKKWTASKFGGKFAMQIFNIEVYIYTLLKQITFEMSVSETG